MVQGQRLELQDSSQTLPSVGYGYSFAIHPLFRNWLLITTDRDVKAKALTCHVGPRIVCYPLSLWQGRVIVRAWH